MNKKIITIIIAAILALTAASFILKNPKVHKTAAPIPQEEKIEEVETISEQETVEPITKEKQTPEKNKPVVVRKAHTPKTLIKQEKTVQKIAEKQTDVKEAAIQTAEPAVEPRLTVDEENGDITILKEFRSQNSFKLKYTPVRFKKK